MSRADFRRRQSRRRRQKLARMSRHLPTLILLLAITVLVGGGIFALYRFVLAKQPDGTVQVIASSGNGSPNPDRGSNSDRYPDGSSGPASGGDSSNQPSAEVPQDDISRLIAQADRIAMGYDYDKAAELINSSGLDLNDSRMKEALARYESQKAALVPADMNAVTHIFFHSLIMDTSKAFDGDSDSANYNSVMTTKDEFLKILEDMYQKGYVLVRIHDVAYEAPDENGNVRFVKGSVMLPEGKKPFVMSQDDVCYYPYMDGDGFAKRVVIGEDGNPTCEMVMDDGTTSTGSYDLIPLLEDFIQEHPDFSYKGARAIIAFTGYEGILGYRTASSYQDSPTYEADREQAARVAQCLKDNGWELASHSWGHRNLGTISMEHFKVDADKWEKNVESLIGPTDIILYPFGSDIGTWKPYTDDNERFTYLKSLGFRYFCNVDASTPYWMQLGPDHFRQGRRNLDGYRMYYYPDSLSDLFNVPDVFDPARPTPVPQM